MNLRTVTAAMALLMGGCVSMGPDYGPALVEQLQPGTSKTEVIALLAQPTTLVRLAGGRQQLMWTHSRLVPPARMLMFGADGRYLGLVSQAETNLR